MPRISFASKPLTFIFIENKEIRVDVKEMYSYPYISCTLLGCLCCRTEWGLPWFLLAAVSPYCIINRVNLI